MALGLQTIEIEFENLGRLHPPFEKETSQRATFANIAAQSSMTRDKL